jgi:hypothetical protein
MPTPTDLVTDLPADFEVFGQAVDTSMADLKGGTSGQVLSKNSNTDMDFVWVTSDDANAIQNTIVDAKGDLIAASASDVPARLAVGANDTVLVAASGEATGLKWATKGEVLLSTTALSGATVTVSSIPQTYTDLKIIVTGATNATANGKLVIRLNGQTTAAYLSGVEKTTAREIPGAEIQTFVNSVRTDTNNVFNVEFNRYAQSDTLRGLKYYGYVSDGGLNAFNYAGMGYGIGAVTSVTILNSGGNLNGGTAYIYGVN